MVERVLAALRGSDGNRGARATFSAVSGGLAVALAGLVVVCSQLGGRCGSLDSALDLAVGVVVQVLAELLLGGSQLDAVLRALRASDGRNDGGQVQLEVLGVLSLRSVLVQPHALSLGVSLDALQGLLVTAGQGQVLDGLIVDREDCGGGTELRRHVTDGCTVSQRQLGNASAVELYELADDAVLAQHIGDGEHNVGCGNARLNVASQLEANDARNEHGDRLAKHCGLSLNTTDTPAQDAQAVLHGRVGVSTNTGVRVCQAVVLEDNASQVLDVDLVDNTGSRRNNAEVGECASTPTEELVALIIALVLNLDVLSQSVFATEGLDDDRVVDDHLCRVQRVNLIRVAAESLNSLTHGSQVNNTGDAGEVLHNNASRGELNLDRRISRRNPVGDSLDVLLSDVGAIFVAQQVLTENLQRVRQLLHTRHGVKSEVVIRLVSDLKLAQGVERVLAFSHSQLHFYSGELSP